MTTIDVTNIAPNDLQTFQGMTSLVDIVSENSFGLPIAAFIQDNVQLTIPNSVDGVDLVSNMDNDSWVVSLDPTQMANAGGSITVEPLYYFKSIDQRILIPVVFSIDQDKPTFNPEYINRVTPKDQDSSGIDLFSNIVGAEVENCEVINLPPNIEVDDNLITVGSTNNIDSTYLVEVRATNAFGTSTSYFSWQVGTGGSIVLTSQPDLKLSLIQPISGPIST